MTNQIQKYNDLALMATVVSASAFHIVTMTPVQLSTNPADKDIYKVGQIGWGDERVDLYALTRTALMKLMTAAGIREVESRRMDDRSDPYYVEWQSVAEWTQPDSTVVSSIGDYQLDLRDWVQVGDRKVRGPRFNISFVKAREQVILDKYKDDKRSKAPNGKPLYGDKLRLFVDDIIVNSPPEELAAIERLADQRALQSILDMRPHIMSRAQSGALDRAVRQILSLKAQYTLAELELPFRVPRSQFDMTAMRNELGAEKFGELNFAKAMKLLDVTPEQIMALRQISAPSTGKPMGKERLETIIDGGELEEVIHEEGEQRQPPPPPPPPEDGVFTEGLLMYKAIGGVVHVGISSSNGEMTWKPAKEQVKVSEATKKKILALYGGNQYHMTGSIRKYFNKGTLAALTWEEFSALKEHLERNRNDPRWFGETQLALPKNEHEVIAESYGVDYHNPQSSLTNDVLAALLKLPEPKCLTYLVSELPFEKHVDFYSALATMLFDGTIKLHDESYEAIVNDAKANAHRPE